MSKSLLGLKCVFLFTPLCFLMSVCTFMVSYDTDDLDVVVGSTKRASHISTYCSTDVFHRVLIY